MSTDAKGKKETIGVFNQHLKDLREAKGLTQAELAEAVGLSRAAIFTYETSDKCPAIDIVMRIAVYFSVSLDWLCGLATTSKGRIMTYADAIDMLKELDMSGAVKIGEAYNGRDGYSRRNLEPDGVMEELISAWGKIADMRREGSIDNDLYSLWVEKRKKDHELIKILEIDFLADNDDGALPF